MNDTGLSSEANNFEKKSRGIGNKEKFEVKTCYSRIEGEQIVMQII